MAKSITADEVVRKWADAGANSAATVKAGVQAVTENPAQKAAQAVDKWVAGVTRSKDKFVQSLNRVSLNDWKQAMLGKGITNMVAGYGDAFNQRKFLTFMRSFLPYVREGAMQVRAMPKNNLQQGIDRCVAQIRWNAKYRDQVQVAPPPRPVG